METDCQVELFRQDVTKEILLLSFLICGSIILFVIVLAWLAFPEGCGLLISRTLPYAPELVSPVKPTILLQ